MRILYFMLTQSGHDINEGFHLQPLTVVTMHFLTLAYALGLAGQAFAGPLSCNNDRFEMTLAESDAAVKEYFSKLEHATKWTSLHDTTGPEAGADVSCFAG